MQNQPVPSSVDWRRWPGAPYDYEVSSDGRIRGIKGAPIRIFQRPDGYIIVALICDGKKALRMLHRIVLETFVGPCPTGFVCAHNDGVRSNNKLENLRWATQKDNLADRRRHGTAPVGSKNGRAKLSSGQAVFIRYSREWLSNTDAAHAFKVSGALVSMIRTGAVWAF